MDEDYVTIRVTDVTGHHWTLSVYEPARPIEPLLDLINASVEEWARD